jgi:hypothetical protein
MGQEDPSRATGPAIEGGAARHQLAGPPILASKAGLRYDWQSTIEPRKGKGFHSIRINGQWRVVFRWTDGQASEVQIVDYL